MKRTLGSSRKTSCVPLPWWTSQSTIATRSRPSSAWRARAAMATLLKRQKPIGSSGVAWWPGWADEREPADPRCLDRRAGGEQRGLVARLRGDGVEREHRRLVDRADQLDERRGCGSARRPPPSPEGLRATRSGLEHLQPLGRSGWSPVGWSRAMSAWLISSIRRPRGRGARGRSRARTRPARSAQPRRG